MNNLSCFIIIYDYYKSWKRMSSLKQIIDNSVKLCKWDIITYYVDVDWGIFYEVCMLANASIDFLENK